MPSEFIAKMGGAVCKWSDDLLIEGIRSRSRLPQKPESVIMFAYPYWTGEKKGRNLSYYAMLPDYHTVVAARLEKTAESLREMYPDNTFVCFCDASPVNEVKAAARAGLGALGKSGLIITQDHGSLVFIGEIVTDLEIECENGVSLCDGCGMCIKACPTGALTGNGLDKALCRSHITQKKGALSDMEEASVREGGLAWGCDCCVMACPLSRRSKITPIDEFLGDIEPVLTLDNLDTLMRNRAFSWRGKAVLKRNLSIIDGTKR